MSITHRPANPALTPMRVRAGAAGVMTVLVVLLLYTFLHEGGHALAGVLLGGTLTGFSIAFWDLSAHASVSGSFSSLERSVTSMAGALLPLVAWGAFMLLVPKGANLALQWLKLISSAGVLSSLLPWLVIPLLRHRPPGDDVTNFLTHSGVAPWMVSVLFALLYVGGWWLFFFKTPKPRAVFLALRDEPEAFSLPNTRRTLAALAAVGAVTAASAAGLSLYAEQVLYVPPEYSMVAQLELSPRTHEREVVQAFTLDAPSQVSYQVLVKKIRSGPAEVLLTGPNGYAVALMRAGEAFEANHATYGSTHHLAPGAYQLELSFPSSPGSVTVFWQLEPANP